jgi:hypothetical protein
VLLRGAPPPCHPERQLGLQLSDANRSIRDLASACAILAAVARRSAPHLIEATLIPAVLFYSCLTLASTRVAIISVLIWAYGAVVCRLAGRRAIPPILLLAVIAAEDSRLGYVQLKGAAARWSHPADRGAFFNQGLLVSPQMQVAWRPAPRTSPGRR